MNILVTNDDGIAAEGLEALVAELGKLCGPDGNQLHAITVIAPDTERSGVSHGMTLRHPTKVRRLNEGFYSCSGTPADCVIVAGLGIVKEKIDLVVSGINRGPNLGTDIVYSGTCAAARQAALVGIPAIAVSCAGHLEPLNYKAAAAFVASNLEPLLAAWKPDSFINVNAPSSPEVDLEALWSIPGRNRYNDTLKCFDGVDGYTYCFLAEGRQERTPNSISDHHVVSLGKIALSLIDINPEASHPDAWNGRVFNRS
jgi:5'-nucleotidase